MRAEVVGSSIASGVLIRSQLASAPGRKVGAGNWALLTSIVATCKLNDVNPVDYIADTLRAILDGHPQSRIEELMPWRFQKTSSLAA